MSVSGQHVFISYKTEEREMAQKIRATLGLVLQCEVWWDQNLQTGGEWSSELDSALRSAAAVVVLWSKKSSASPWVQQEAAVARALGTLTPVIIENCEIPAPYRGVHAARLERWDSKETHPEFVKLAQRIRVRLDERSAARAAQEESNLGEPDSAWWVPRPSPKRFWSLLVLMVGVLIGAFSLGAWFASPELPRLSPDGQPAAEETCWRIRFGLNHLDWAMNLRVPSSGVCFAKNIKQDCFYGVGLCEASFTEQALSIKVPKMTTFGGDGKPNDAPAFFLKAPGTEEADVIAGMHLTYGHERPWEAERIDCAELVHWVTESEQ